ncbi:hypothetical protein JQ543_05810 [Bradyrhizobium diazoefficiens]|nr:hypothetical protein [Bradyrhizobium diazoefficiens]MBR0847256.1 hypothetical protein [Bradyrhizobium diazoefficiens]
MGGFSRFQGGWAGSPGTVGFSSGAVIAGFLRRTRPTMPMTTIKVPTITSKTPAVEDQGENSSNAMAASIAVYVMISRLTRLSSLYQMVRPKRRSSSTLFPSHKP